MGVNCPRNSPRSPSVPPLVLAVLRASPLPSARRFSPSIHSVLGRQDLLSAVYCRRPPHCVQLHSVSVCVFRPRVCFASFLYLPSTCSALCRFCLMYAMHPTHPNTPHTPQYTPYIPIHPHTPQYMPITPYTPIHPTHPNTSQYTPYTPVHPHPPSYPISLFNF